MQKHFTVNTSSWHTIKLNVVVEDLIKCWITNQSDRLCLKKLRLEMFHGVNINKTFEEKVEKIAYTHIATEYLSLNYKKMFL